jgi:type II secretory pathway pseudopilin PulG
MARVKLSFGNKVGGSSILEVVVAMVVIVMVLGIALMIFGNVTRSSLSVKQLRAQAILNRQMALMADSGEQGMADTVASGWKLLKEAQPYSGGGRLQQVHLSLLDENQDTIAQLRQVIISTQTNNNSSNEAAR